MPCPYGQQFVFSCHVPYKVFYCCRFYLCSGIWGAYGPLESCYSWCTWHSISWWTLCFRPVPTSWVSPYTSCMASSFPCKLRCANIMYLKIAKGFCFCILVTIGLTNRFDETCYNICTNKLLHEYGIPCLHFVCNMWHVGVNVQNCSKPIITLEGWDWIQISMRVEKSVSVC